MKDDITAIAMLTKAIVLKEDYTEADQPGAYTHLDVYKRQDEFMQVFDNAINSGYPIAWGSDVSEQGFTRDGVAAVSYTHLDVYKRQFQIWPEI